MAAIQKTRNSSSAVGMVVVALGAALLVGASGGYLVRALTSAGSTQVAAGLNRPLAAANQGGPQSDLTRALPVEAPVVPGWVQNYMKPAETRSFKVDEFIKSLSYDINQGGPLSDLTRALPVEASSVPAWVQNYSRPAESGTFKVDDLIKSLSYASAFKK
jgi:hypothetical protein